MSSTNGTLETNGARIYYEVEGSGEPVVLIHAGVADLRMWDDQVAALRDSYRVIRYDTRGFGRTETDAVEFSNRADIAALLDHLGGRVGARRRAFARRTRSRSTSRSNFPSGCARSSWRPEGSVAMTRATRRPKAGIRSRRGPRPTTGFAVAEWETAYWADGPGQPADRVDPAVRARVHDWILTNYQAEKEEGQPQPLDPPAAGRLGELRAPLLVMLGTLDDPGTSDSMRHLADAVPGARLEVFEGSAHMLNLEQPDRFNALLLEFFGGAGAGPSWHAPGRVGGRERDRHDPPGCRRPADDW